MQSVTQPFRFAFLVCLLLLAACGSSATNTGTAVTPTPTSAASTPTPTPTPSHFKVGQVVKVGDTWQVTVNSIKTSQGSEFTKPKTGNIFLVVDVTLKNISPSEQQAYSAQFTLRDATGQEYNETFFDSQYVPPNGKVEAGSPLRGQISYEVPTSQKHFTLAFVASFGAPGQTIWDITI